MKYKYGNIEVLKIHEDDIVVNRRKIEDGNYEVAEDFKDDGKFERNEKFENEDDIKDQRHMKMVEQFFCAPERKMSIKERCGNVVSAELSFVNRDHDDQHGRRGVWVI